MLDRFISFIYGLFRREPVRLAIVRRYTDANGAYVGELYMEQVLGPVRSYYLIGASLDTFPLETAGVMGFGNFNRLDTENDFLAPMPEGTLRVGALNPGDNDAVRRTIARLPQRRMHLIIQNRFIEHILERKRV